MLFHVIWVFRCSNSQLIASTSFSDKKPRAVPLMCLRTLTFRWTSQGLSWSGISSWIGLKCFSLLPLCISIRERLYLPRGLSVFAISWAFVAWCLRTNDRWLYSWPRNGQVCLQAHCAHLLLSLNTIMILLKCDGWSEKSTVCLSLHSPHNHAGHRAQPEVYCVHNWVIKLLGLCRWVKWQLVHIYCLLCWASYMHEDIQKYTCVESPWSLVHDYSL